MSIIQSASRVERITAALAVLLLVASLGVHLVGVATRANHDPHLDENEYLHAGWLMANGGRLYETFFEHHSPLFFKVLELLAPEGEGVDVRPYFQRARWLSGAFGLVALLAVAALLRPLGWEAAAIGIGLIIATGTLWNRGLLQVRAEPFALACFFGGTVIAMRWRGAVGGAGVGLVAIASLWQPKWPIASLLIGVIWLLRSDRRIAGILAGTATLGAGIAAIAAIVPLDMWWFFNYEVNVALTSAITTQHVMDTFFSGGAPFFFVPDAFHPLLVVPAAALVAAAAWRDRCVHRILPALLLAAALVEIRFVYPWPAIWSHYYLMWGFAGAMVFAALPSSIRLLIERPSIRPELARAIVVAVTLLGLGLTAAHVVAVAPVSGVGSTYWNYQKYVRERVRPGEIVWLESARQPVTIRSGHYYWFSIGQMVAAARELRKTPRGARYLPPPAAFPVCGPDPRLRFTFDARRSGLPGAGDCMQRLIDAGRIEPTVFLNVWEVRRAAAR